jgi:hypothetical protein
MCAWWCLPESFADWLLEHYSLEPWCGFRVLMCGATPDAVTASRSLYWDTRRRADSFETWSSLPALKIEALSSDDRASEIGQRLTALRLDQKRMAKVFEVVTEAVDASEPDDLGDLDDTNDPQQPHPDVPRTQIALNELRARCDALRLDHYLSSVKAIERDIERIYEVK